MFLGKDSRYWYDVAERVGSIFIITFLTVWLGPVLADGNLQPDEVKSLLALAVIQKAALAAVAAVLALLKSVIASFIGNKETASLLPASKDPATPPVA